MNDAGIQDWKQRSITIMRAKKNKNKTQEGLELRWNLVGI